MKPKLLIVDDDEGIRTQLRWALAPDYEILLAEDRATATELFRTSRPPVVLLDLGLPPQPGTPDEGLATLSEMLATDNLAKVVIVTGQGEKNAALRAIGAGAYDFLGKPVEMDEMKLLLKRCFHVAHLEREYREMQQRFREDSFEGMLGNSSRMQAVFDSIRKVATTDAPVLLSWESGTGKEMVAQAIHQRSARKDGPFAAINCSAIPETLLESELFGHEKGAFTGAHVQRKGRIENPTGERFPGRNRGDPSAYPSEAAAIPAGTTHRTRGRPAGDPGGHARDRCNQRRSQEGFDRTPKSLKLTSEPEMSLLKVESVHSGYGKMTVLEDVSFRVEKGEFIVLIGPDGRQNDASQDDLTWSTCIRATSSSMKRRSRG